MHEVLVNCLYSKPDRPAMTIAVDLGLKAKRKTVTVTCESWAQAERFDRYGFRKGLRQAPTQEAITLNNYNGIRGPPISGYSWFSGCSQQVVLDPVPVLIRVLQVFLKGVLFLIFINALPELFGSPVCRLL